MSHDRHSQRAVRPSSSMYPRTDFRTRDVVNQAIAAVPTLGIQQVAEFLSAMNVPSEVAIRALAESTRRKD